MAKVFISYSRKDIEFAKRLTGELQKSDLDFWIDWEGIPPTVDWWKEIEKGIEEADIFLFLISPDSSKSKVCGMEIDHAVQNGKRLVPLVVRDVKADEAPPQLTQLNWIFFRENDDFDSAFKKLLTSIHTDYEWVQTHRRLQVKALEWERNHKENSFLLRGKDLQDAEFQLARNTSKEPHPTDLQREYVFESRKATDRQRRITTSISIAGVITLAALAVFGFVQAGLAKNAQILAEGRANIALGRQLAAQSQILTLEDYTTTVQSGLLAVEAGKRGAGWSANQALRRYLTLTTMPVEHLPEIRIEQETPTTLIAYSPDGKHIISVAGTVIKVWDPNTGKEVTQMTHEGGVVAAVFSPNSQYIISAGNDSTARVWEANTGKEIAYMTFDDGVTSTTFSPNGEYVISGSNDKSARVWEAMTGKEISHMTFDDAVTSTAYSPNGDYVVSGSRDDSARVWEAMTGKEISRMAFDDAVTSTAFSPDGKYVVSGSDDGTIRVWEAMTGKEISRFTSALSALSVLISPDGKYIASIHGDSGIHLWEATTGKETAHMNHDNAVTSIAFNSDGRYLVSGSGDSDWSVRVWDTTTGKEMARITHDESIIAVAFSPDSKYVVSTAWDDTIRIWYWQTEDLIAEVCRGLPRNFTRAEWAQYIGDESYRATCPNFPIEPEPTPTATP